MFRPSTPEQVLWTLSGIMAGASLLLFVTVLPDLRQLLPPADIPLWLAIGVFALGELLVANLRVREDAVSTSLAEVPMAVGLLYLSPREFIIARTLGTAIAVLQRSAAPLKVAYNVALLTATGTLSVILHRVMLGTAEPAGLRGWVVLITALLLGQLVTTAMVFVAIQMTSEDVPVESMVRVAGFGLVNTMTLSIAGILLGVATWHEPSLLWVAAAAMFGIYALLKTYGSLGDQYFTLRQLYDFSRVISGEGSVDGGARLSLERGAAMIGATRGDLYVPWVGERPHWQFQRGRVSHGDLDARAASQVGALADEGATTLRIDGRDDEGPRAALARLGYQDVIVAPVRGHDAVGWLAFDLQITERDDEAQRDLIETIAGQTASALGRSELVDRLRAEADERERRALHDRLTGLPNRDYFTQRLDRLVHGRQVGDEIAVLMIDLDHFKEVNDSLGHQYGDLLLKEVASRLRHKLRSSEFLARLGGDEFGVIVSAPDAGVAAAQLSERIAELLEQPIGIAGTTIAVGGSIGISLCPRHAEDPDALLRQSDIAMYAAKRDDLPFVIYEAETEEVWLRRLQVLGRLRASSMDEAIEVHFQPQVDLATGRPVGVEVLARWTDSELGVVSPVEFIPVAEQSGMIRALTLSVLAKSLPAIRHWEALGHRLRVAVNLSGRALLDLEVVDAVREAISKHRLDPRDLVIEVTESVFVSDSQRLNEVLLAYDDLGVTLSIDDFGTGYSSLAYLRRLPADELKIDRSFVDGMTKDDSKLAIVRSTVALAHELGMKAVAEGIEDRPTLELLASIGCDTGQGYLIGRPQPLPSLLAWLKEQDVPPMQAVADIAAHEADVQRSTGADLPRGQQ